jgi:hypothetical protein
MAYVGIDGHKKQRQMYLLTAARRRTTFSATGQAPLHGVEYRTEHGAQRGLRQSHAI